MYDVVFTSNFYSTIYRVRSVFFGEQSIKLNIPSKFLQYGYFYVNLIIGSRSLPLSLITVYPCSLEVHPYLHKIFEITPLPTYYTVYMFLVT